MKPSMQELQSQLDHLISTVQASIADPVRPSPLREAIHSSKNLLRRCSDGRQAAE